MMLRTKKAEENLIKPVGLALGTYLFAQSEDMVYMMKDLFIIVMNLMVEKI